MKVFPNQKAEKKIRKLCFPVRVTLISFLVPLLNFECVRFPFRFNHNIPPALEKEGAGGGGKFIVIGYTIMTLSHVSFPLCDSHALVFLLTLFCFRSVRVVRTESSVDHLIIIFPPHQQLDVLPKIPATSDQKKAQCMERNQQDKQ